MGENSHKSQQFPALRSAVIYLPGLVSGGEIMTAINRQATCEQLIKQAICLPPIKMIINTGESSEMTFHA